MNKKLLIALSLIAGQAMAMEPRELTINNEQAMPTDTTEEKVVITIQGQERELPKRYIPLIGTLAALYKEDSLLQMSPITKISLDTWQLIEDQLERVYAISCGDQQLRDKILVDYCELATSKFIDLIIAVDFLEIPLLKEITLELEAHYNLTFDEIFQLPQYLRNEIIKRKALSIIGPIQTKYCLQLANSITSVAVTDGKIIAGSADGIIHICDTHGNKLTECIGHSGQISSITITHDGKIVSGSWDFTIRIWDMDGNQLAECIGHEGRVNSLCVTPEDEIVSCSVDGTVRIWDMNHGQQRAIWEGHRFEASSVCTPSAGKIASGGFDEAIRIWNMDGEQLAQCEGHTAKIWSVCVASDNKMVSAAGDNTVRIWDSKGQQIAKLENPFVHLVYVTAKGKIISGAGDKTVRIWDITGRELGVCRGHEGTVVSISVTSDNKIISGSDDTTMRIWDMNGNQLAICAGHTSSVSYIGVTSDGKIVSGSLDGTVRIWDAMILLHRLANMNQDQAQAISKILKSSVGDTKKEHAWAAIREILKEAVVV